MSTRTVRFDDETEKALSRLLKMTGLSISDVIKRGVQTYEQQAREEGHARPYEIYRGLELGKGGWSIAPAAESKRAVREALRRKLRS